ncbi:MAG TPA: FAD-dependent oxidoreductase [Kofleriaceae bacterium]|nr:FAD-dependent oxidoreductase [Kofleriaceae bacterium]
MNVAVVGGGIFGVTAALELRARGCDVTVFDPGPLPHPLAESTDISKVVRCDYGGDEPYTILGERALDGWRRWNAAWPVARYHESGVMFLSRQPMQRGGFEHDSYELLARRGHHVERLDAHAIAARFPAYRPGAFVDGYFHRDGGWAESGAVVADLAMQCLAAGVAIRAHTVKRLVPDGVVLDGEHVPYDAIVVCAGSWTQHLVPELAGSLRAIGQPVFHLAPANPSLFEAERFPVFGGDIATTGYYGFPLAGGIVKIANHGTGRPVASAVERVVTADQEQALRAFLRDALPALADAPITHRRLCVYGDSLDGHFWITRHPEQPHLTIAAGGSGHAFKFAPVLGALIADTVLTGDNALADRFRWRSALQAAAPGDAARAK